MPKVLVLLLAAALPHVAYANCYVLQNNTDSPQIWHFQYSKSLPGAKTQLRLAAHAQFPANRAWCWDTPSEYYATASIDPGAYTPSWQGTFVLGNGGNASPSGTYSLSPLRSSSAENPADSRLPFPKVELLLKSLITLASILALFRLA
jgi:hypothetical protein